MNIKEIELNNSVGDIKSNCTGKLEPSASRIYEIGSNFVI